MGSKKRPFYRIVVADSRAPRDGRFVEVLGTYNPRTEPIEVKVDPERLHVWLTQGAEPTDTVKSLLKKKGLLAKLA
jgi:small subunit ribosomal protein S16